MATHMAARMAPRMADFKNGTKPMSPRILLRMARWARKPPSKQQIKIAVIVLGLCAAVFAAERLGLTPDWMEAQRGWRKNR